MLSAMRYFRKVFVDKLRDGIHSISSAFYWRHIKNDRTGICGAKCDDFVNGTNYDYAYYYVQRVKGIEMKEMKQRIILELNDLKLLLVNAHHDQWNNCPDSLCYCKTKMVQDDEKMKTNQ